MVFGIGRGGVLSPEAVAGPVSLHPRGEQAVGDGLRVHVGEGSSAVRSGMRALAKASAGRAARADALLLLECACTMMSRIRCVSRPCARRAPSGLPTIGGLVGEEVATGAPRPLPRRLLASVSPDCHHVREPRGSRARRPCTSGTPGSRSGSGSAELAVALELLALLDLVERGAHVLGLDVAE